LWNDTNNLYERNSQHVFTRMSPVTVGFDESLVGNIMMMFFMCYCYKEVNALAPNSNLDTEADRGGVW